MRRSALRATWVFSWRQASGTRAETSTSVAEQDEQKLRVLLDETLRQRAMISERRSAMQSRAVVLVGSSAVIGSIQSTIALSPLVIVALILTVVAVILGVLALMPKSGPEVDVSALRNEGMKLSTVALLTVLIDQNLDSEEDEQGRLKKLAWLIKLGFIFLAASIVVLSVATVSGLGVCV
ncbi:hypothetical protein [Schaalia sp. JY-X169]|uniref:hypothetical protein n=1 Tax=Schaalia sp. JY-X169 TaxID=2758572 RepID=UPI0015F67940|nr:hypothetical protein [Schaalia sp. JY-X169]